MIIRVTDHALIRYMERVHDIDMEAFRDALRSEVSDAAITAGALIGGQYAVRTGRHAYVCEGDTVITVIRRRGATLMVGGAP